ncbi:MAG: hypothetical protein NWQ09_10825, partial [Nonlabens sp.]|nr:hypothetical protein [Nonlabens sp.]
MKTRVLFIGLLFSLFGAMMAQGQDGKGIKTDTVNGIVVRYYEVKDGDRSTFEKWKEHEITLLKQSKIDYEVKQRESLAAFFKMCNERLQNGKIDDATA